MKRFLSWLLAVMIAAAAVITTSVPGSVCAANGNTTDDINYKSDANSNRSGYSRANGNFTNYTNSKCNTNDDSNYAGNTDSNNSRSHTN